MKIIEIFDADYFTSWVLLFCFYVSQLLCVWTPPCTRSLRWFVPFDTLPVMSTHSTFTSVVVSGSISFRLLLLHFHYYYGVCVSGSTPFGFIITSLLLWSVSGLTPFRLSFISLLLGCVCVRFDTLSIIIISHLLRCCVRFDTLSICHYFIFYYGVRRVRHAFDYQLSHFLLWCPSGFAYSPPFNCHYFLFSYGGVGFATLLIIIYHYEGMSSNQTLLTRMGKKQTLLPGLLLTVVSACMRRLWLILLLLCKFWRCLLILFYFH